MVEKLAVLDETGNLLEDTIIYPHAPQKKRAESLIKLEELIRKHQVTVIALGNGTASRETEDIIAELLARLQQPPVLLRPQGHAVLLGHAVGGLLHPGDGLEVPRPRRLPPWTCSSARPATGIRTGPR